MNFFDSLMAPLSRDHCMIIFYLGIVNLFFAVALLVTSVFNLFDKKTMSRGGVLLINSFVAFFMYYLYRIAYSICIKAL
tara:strand:- start:2542 stop:2778 length:237 start_codon:yes stop_codon:yes gene_type:complete